MEDGFSYVDQLDRLEDELLSKEVFVKQSSPFYRLAKFQRSSPQAADLSRRALRHIEAARSLKERSVHLVLFFAHLVEYSLLGQPPLKKLDLNLFSLLRPFHKICAIYTKEK